MYKNDLHGVEKTAIWSYFNNIGYVIIKIIPTGSGLDDLDLHSKMKITSTLITRVEIVFGRTYWYTTRYTVGEVSFMQSGTLSTQNSTAHQ